MNAEKKRLLKNGWGHLKTITTHKIAVMDECFKVGLYKQGLLHDLSKYTPEEFRTGVYFFQGTRSPNAAEKEFRGYSKAWLHHKGRNKHHFEYWIDLAPNREDGLQGAKMPVKYVIEMFLDRVAAAKIYHKNDYTDCHAWNYYNMNKQYITMHPDTRKLLERLLKMLCRYGERRTMSYIRNVVLTGKYKY
ncbi:MAG: catalase [Clostridia bacterium]|nr:DUF5662 family protein [Lachnospiraceae bacterium]NCC00047.1 catalase [Clostridia bacterium]NCD01891.1 catalase [Clostridia bacterium]